MPPDGFARRGAGLRAGAVLAALGGALVAAALIALVVSLVTGPDDGGGVQARPGTAAASPVLDDHRFGVRLQLPAGWRRLPGAKAIRLQSADRRLGVTVSSVASHPDLAGLRPSVERSVTSSLRGARVLQRVKAPVGGEPAWLSAIAGRNARGQALDALAITVASPWRTYAIVAYGSPRAGQASLRAARVIVSSLHFSRPGRSSG